MLGRLRQRASRIVAATVRPAVQQQTRDLTFHMTPTNVATRTPGHITSVLSKMEASYSKRPDNPYRGFGGGGVSIKSSTPLMPYAETINGSPKTITPVFNAGRYDAPGHTNTQDQKGHTVVLNKRGVETLDEVYESHLNSKTAYFTTEHSKIIDNRRTTNCVGYQIRQLDELTGQKHEFPKHTKPQDLFEYVGKNKALLTKAMIFNDTVDKSEGAEIPWVNTHAEERRSRIGTF